MEKSYSFFCSMQVNKFEEDRAANRNRQKSTTTLKPSESCAQITRDSHHFSSPQTLRKRFWRAELLTQSADRRTIDHAKRTPRGNLLSSSKPFPLDKATDGKPLREHKSQKLMSVNWLFIRRHQKHAAMWETYITTGDLHDKPSPNKARSVNIF